MEQYYYILWQSFWILAAIITVCAFIYSDKDKTVKLLLVGSFMWFLQFLFLWALSGAFISLFGFFRIILSKLKGHDREIISLLFIIITIITYVTYDGYLSLLPAVATYIWTYAIFYLQWVSFRVALLVPTTLWLIYNYYVWSVWWTIREIIILTLHIKVIILSLGFAYRAEIYKLNYDIFVYLYNNSFSRVWVALIRSQAFLKSVWQKSFQKMKWVSSKMHLSGREDKWVLEWTLSNLHLKK